MPSLVVNGTLLEYEECGSGEPLVLVHGSASDHRTWQEQKTAFSAKYRVIAYSRRYHWPNAPIPEGADYSMFEQVDDLQALLQKLTAAPAHLVGHSYGAFLCLLLAIKEPRLVRSLVLAEPPAITLFASSTPKPSEILKLLIKSPRTALAVISFGLKGVAPARSAARHGDVKKAMHLSGMAIMGKRFFLRLSASRLEQVDANSIKAEFLGSGFAPLQEEELRKLKVPALLITGQYSHPLFHHITDRLEEILPNTKRIEIEDASHIMHEDNASAYNQAVLLFLEQQE
jgi:pimeloyl-ACP methyl ester carboxylesterase